MSKHQKPSADFASAYREAGQILGSNGNRLLLIEAILISLLTVLLYVFLCDTYVILLGYWMYGTDLWLSVVLSVLLGVLISLLTLFFTIPLLIGLFGLAGDVEQGRACVLADLFSPFSSAKTYRRALALSWGAFWRLGLTVLAVSLTCHVGVLFFEGSLLAGLICGVAVAVEILVGLWLCGKCFSSLSVAHSSDVPIKDAREYAKGIWRMCRTGGAIFVLNLLPRILLGLLTLGVLLLWDTLPRMLVAYFRYCRYMNEMIIRSEEYKQ